MSRTILLVCLCFATLGTGLAQGERAAEILAQRNIPSAFFDATNGAPRLGEPVTLTLYVLTTLGGEVVQVGDLALLDERIEIIEASDFVVAAENSSSTLWQQDYQIRLWLTGQWITPEIAVKLRSGGTDFEMPIQSFAFTVPSEISTVADPSLRPSAPPIDLDFFPAWLNTAAIALGIALTGITPLLLRRAFRSMRAITTSTPAQIAISELEDLSTQELSPLELYTLVAARMRSYINARFEVIAQEATTSEVLQSLEAQSNLSPDARRGLRQILDNADLVKFARYQPSNDEPAKLLRYAIRWVQEAERQTELGTSDG